MPPNKFQLVGPCKECERRNKPHITKYCIKICGRKRAFELNKDWQGIGIPGRAMIEVFKHGKELEAEEKKSAGPQMCLICNSYPMEMRKTGTNPVNGLCAQCNKEPFSKLRLEIKEILHSFDRLENRLQRQAEQIEHVDMVTIELGRDLDELKKSFLEHFHGPSGQVARLIE